MAMEAETITMLTMGFTITIVISLIIVLWLWYKRKNLVNVWFLVQSVFLALSFYYILEALKGRPEISAGMLSEENSLSIGKAGVLWAISMVSMLCGIWQLNTVHHKGRKG